MSRNDTQQIVFEEHEKTQPTPAPDEGGPARQFSIDTQDIVAIGALVLCIGAVCVAVIVALGFAFGKIDGNPATKPIGVVSAVRQSVGCRGNLQRRKAEKEVILRCCLEHRPFGDYASLTTSRADALERG